MDQIKIGKFLKELRKEKNLSQEQLAEKFNVSSRSISRWENGITMPDISLIIELAEFYDIELHDLLSGERKGEKINDELKETLAMVVDYTNAEKEKIINNLLIQMMASAVFFIIIGIFQLFRINRFFENATVFCITFGAVFSVESIINLMQIIGQINKVDAKKIRRIFLIIVITLFLISVAGMLWEAGILKIL